MHFLDKEETKRRMNVYGKASQPFFFVIDYEQKNNIVCKPEEVPADNILYNFRGITNIKEDSSGIVKKLSQWEVYPQTQQAYEKAFRIVQRHILQGNSYLVNLTCATPVKIDISLKDIFYQAKAPYKLWMKNSFVCFSPEIFVQIRDGYIYSYPMKGTRDATLPNAAEALLADLKETAEHATITDLIRNDLSRVATEVIVTRYRYLDEIITHTGKLLQMSSEIRGKLPLNWKNELGNILFELLPAGSITGAPKKKTMQIIAEAEEQRRNFYTGIAGYFNGNELDSCVMIRFIEQQNNCFYYHSGGGITAQSRLEDEYKEMIQKIYVPIC